MDEAKRISDQILELWKHLGDGEKELLLSTLSFLGDENVRGKADRLAQEMIGIAEKVEPTR